MQPNCPYNAEIPVEDEMRRKLKTNLRGKRWAWISSKLRHLKAAELPPDPPIDQVVAALESRQDRKALIKDLIASLPLLATALMLVTLITYFGGDFSAVQAAVEYTDVSTAILGVVLTFASQIFLAIFFAGPGIAADHRFRVEIRKRYASLGVSAIAVSAFLLPAIITFAALVVGPVLYVMRTHTSARAARASSKDVTEWLGDGSIMPDDVVVAKLRSEALALVDSIKSKSDSNPTIRESSARLTSVLNRIVARYSEIREARRLVWSDAIYQTLVATIGSNILLIIVLPPPLGPNYLLEFSNGETRVMRMLDKGKDHVFLVDAKSRRPEVVPRSSIKEVKLCVGNNDGFLFRPLAASIGDAGRWTTAGARGAATCPGF